MRDMRDITLKKMDSLLRENNGKNVILQGISVIPATFSVIPVTSSVIPATSSVIPAKAGIQEAKRNGFPINDFGNDIFDDFGNDIFDDFGNDAHTLRSFFSTSAVVRTFRMIHTSVTLQKRPLSPVTLRSVSEEESHKLDQY